MRIMTMHRLAAQKPKKRPSSVYSLLDLLRGRLVQGAHVVVGVLVAHKARSVVEADLRPAMRHEAQDAVSCCIALGAHCRYLHHQVQHARKSASVPKVREMLSVEIQVPTSTVTEMER